MQNDEWQELNSGDVLYNKILKQTFVVVDTGLQGDGIVIVTRTFSAQNPEEWERKRKVVDVE